MAWLMEDSMFDLNTNQVQRVLKWCGENSGAGSLLIMTAFDVALIKVLEQLADHQVADTPSWKFGLPSDLKEATHLLESSGGGWKVRLITSSQEEATKCGLRVNEFINQVDSPKYYIVVMDK